MFETLLDLNNYMGNTKMIFMNKFRREAYKDET